MRIVRLFPLGLLVAIGAMADELPDSSLLQRYGVQPKDLSVTESVPEQSAKPQPSLVPEQPWEGNEFSWSRTDNPTINAMDERDRRIRERNRQHESISYRYNWGQP